MIVPGYYQAECSEKKPCKEGMYCNVLYCEKCHKLNVACNNNEQCCKGTVCTFGRCEKKSKGDPGKGENPSFIEQLYLTVQKLRSQHMASSSVGATKVF